MRYQSPQREILSCFNHSSSIKLTCLSCLQILLSPKSLIEVVNFFKIFQTQIWKRCLQLLALFPILPVSDPTHWVLKLNPDPLKEHIRLSYYWRCTGVSGPMHIYGLLEIFPNYQTLFSYYSQQREKENCCIFFYQHEFV